MQVINDNSVKRNICIYNVVNYCYYYYCNFGSITS